MPSRRWPASDPALRILSESDVLDDLQIRCWPYETMEDQARTRSLAASALEHLIGLGLPCSVVNGRRMFEPCEVSNFMVWAHQRLGDGLWAETCVRAQRRMADEHLGWGDRRLAISIERDVALEGAPGALSRTQIPLPVDCPPQSEIAIGLRGGRGVRVARVGDRLDARARVGAGPTLHVGVDITFRAGWQGLVVEPDRVEPFREPETELAPYLAASERPIRLTDRVRALARSVAGDAHTPWDAVRRFWSHIFVSITPGDIPYDELEGHDVLSRIVEIGRADCWHVSALLVGLCRARGIPARLVGGLDLFRPAIPFHYWCEVHVRPYGWLPFDLMVSWGCAAGDPGDPVWSERFLGRLPPRLVFERFPRQRFVLGPRLPKRFFMKRRVVPGGTEIVFHARDDCRMIFADRMRLRASSPVT